MAIILPRVCQGFLKSPFEKGGFRGILKSYKNPPRPSLEKGGKCALLEPLPHRETILFIKYKSRI
jgi:hypothetical protein